MLSRKLFRRGFTLIEVLIVVVIMAVLAAMIVPRFIDSAEDSKESVLKFNLHSLRSQLQLYKIHHLGLTPVLKGQQLPQLTAATNEAGDIGSAGPNFRFGPYIVTAMPDNPYNGLNTVAPATSVPPTAEVSNAGWQYDEASGQIWPNTLQFLKE